MNIRHCLEICLFVYFFAYVPIVASADNSGSIIQIAALDSVDGPPPCGRDGACNIAVCPKDPDCGPNPPDNPAEPTGDASPSRPDDIIDCRSRESKEIGLAIDFGKDNWSSFERALEGIRDWPVDIGNCLENRFKKNGKVVCEQAMQGRCRVDATGETKGWASPFNKRCHMCSNFLSDIRSMSGPASNRQACYFALVTHEWAHTCERTHKTIEIIDDEAFDFWKINHPDVTIDYDECNLG